MEVNILAVNILEWIETLGADEKSASKSITNLKNKFMEADSKIASSLSNIGATATNFSELLSGDAINGISAFSEALMNSASMGQGFQNFLSTTSKEATNAESSLSTLATNIEQIGNISNIVGEFAQKTSSIASFFGSVSQGSANLVSQISNVPNMIKIFTTNSSNQISQMASKSIAELGKFSGGLKNIAQGTGEVFGKLVPDSAKNKVMSVIDNTQNRFAGFGNAIKGNLLGSFNSVSGGLTAFQSKLSTTSGGGFFGMIGQASEKLKSLLPSFGKIGTGAQTILSQGTSMVSGVVGKTTQALTSVLGLALNMIGPGVLLGGVILGLGLLQGAYGETLNELLLLVTTKGPEIIQALIDGAMTKLPGIMEMGTNLLVNFLEALAINLPLLLQGGMQLITMLLQGVTESLPLIMAAVIPIIGALLEGIIQALPLLMTSGLSLLQGLIDGIFSNMDLIILTITQVIGTLTQAIQQNLPLIIEKGITILVSLINGIVQALPKLIPLALNLFTVLVNAILSNLPRIIAGGTKILRALIDGAIALLPQLPPMISRVFFSLIQAISANLPSILQKGIELLGTLGSGILRAIPALLALLPAVWNGITRVFKAVDWLSIGKNIIDGIGRGIRSAGGALWDTAKSLLGSFKDNVLGFFGIHSPSRVFRDEVGKFIPQGIAVGIDQDADEMQKSLDYAAAKLKFSPEIARNQSFTPTALKSPLGIKNADQSKLESIMENLLMTISNLNNQSQEINIEVDGYTIAKVMRDPLDRELGKKYKDKMQSKGRR